MNEKKREAEGLVKNGWKLLYRESGGQRIWQRLDTGAVSLADHSGDDRCPDYGIGTPSDTDDGPLHVLRGATLSLTSTPRGIRVLVPVRASPFPPRSVEPGQSVVVVSAACAEKILDLVPETKIMVAASANELHVLQRLLARVRAGEVRDG